MKYIITQTHYEYNDETYVSPDAQKGKEPGTPVAIFDDSATAETERWRMEIERWRSNESVGMYTDAFDDSNVYRNPTSQYQIAHNEKVKMFKRKYADIVNAQVDDVDFGYEFSLPEGLTDEQVRKIVELCDGPIFYNVFTVE